MSIPHPGIARRTAVQAGAISLLGLGTNHVSGLQTLAAENSQAVPRKHKAVIYIFLSGGLGQQDSFDLKPDAPDRIRGEFSPISTTTTGLQICEHLPMLAARSHKWGLVRSLTHPYNEHSEGHMVMLSGRTPLPQGFSGSKPKPTDWPTFASVVTGVCPPKNNLPPAAVLPEKLIHVSGRTIPGQFAGIMGDRYEPWFIEASHFRDTSYVHGAFPEYGFQRWEGPSNPKNYRFEAPKLELAHGVLKNRMAARKALLTSLEDQRAELARAAASQEFDRHREDAVSLLLDGGVHRALDVHSANDKTQDAYGRNSFGWSLLMARQLVEAGVNLVQVNLGNDESWDTHEKAFHNLKHYLFPPTDRAVSALIDDLDARGMLDDTLVVWAGEFGRTNYCQGVLSGGDFGRDHHPRCYSIWMAGGGIKAGSSYGETDEYGYNIARDGVHIHDFQATLLHLLGIDHERLTYRHQGRRYRLTDVHGQVVKPLLA